VRQWSTKLFTKTQHPTDGKDQKAAPAQTQSSTKEETAPPPPPIDNKSDNCSNDSNPPATDAKDVKMPMTIPVGRVDAPPAALVRNELVLTFSFPSHITLFSASFVDSTTTSSTVAGEKDAVHLARVARTALLPSSLRAGIWSSTTLYVPGQIDVDGMLVVATSSGSTLSLVRERVLDASTSMQYKSLWQLLANETLRRMLRDETHLRRGCLTFPAEAKTVADKEQNLQLEIVPALDLSVRKTLESYSVQVSLRHLITDPRTVGELLRDKVVTAASILETKRVINRSDDRAFVVDAVDLQNSLATVQKGAVLAGCRKALETRDPQKWSRIQAVANLQGLIISHYKNDEKKQPIYLSVHHCALPGAPNLTSNNRIRREVMSHIDNSPERLWHCMQLVQKKLLAHPCAQAWGWNLALPTPTPRSNASSSYLLAPPKILLNDSKCPQGGESLSADGWALPRHAATCKPFGVAPRPPCRLVVATPHLREVKPVADLLAKALGRSSLGLQLVPLRDLYDDDEWKAVWPQPQPPLDEKKKSPLPLPLVLLVNGNGPSTSASSATDYAWFKRECGRRGCVSQVINLSTLRRLAREPAKLASYVDNLAVQIQAKLGMPQWKVPNPAGSMTTLLQGKAVCTTMVVGVDVCHEAVRAGVDVRSAPALKDRLSPSSACDAAGELHEGPGSTAAVGVVASLNADMTQWTEIAAFQAPGHDRVAHMAHIAYRLIATFTAHNGRAPAHILVFRDGLAREQMTEWTKQELACWQQAAIKHGLSELKFSMLVCTKRTHVRLLDTGGGGGGGAGKPLKMQVPRVGHVMFHEDQFPGFDLVTTVHPNRAMLARPTRYSIVRNDVGWTRSQWLEFTARRTVGYMNWRGTVSLPDALMYAHRVAYMCGRDTSMQDPGDRLSAYHSLFFL
jgi:hypothetical protein